MQLWASLIGSSKPDFFNTISADCKFACIEILRSQRMAGSTGRTAASRSAAGCPQWAVDHQTAARQANRFLRDSERSGRCPLPINANDT